MHVVHQMTVRGTAILPGFQIPLMNARAPAAEQDRRWPSIRRRLQALRDARRRSVRVIDLCCGGGEFLLHVARAARAMGFVAVEVRGVDRDAARIGRARHAGRRVTDRGIGVEFGQEQAAAVLQDEAAFPADLILCDAEQARDAELMRAAHAAGRTVVCGQSAAEPRRAA